MKKNSQMPGKTNWPVTILLILGCITIFFPLYMAVIIAFKKPSEMTNDPCRPPGAFRILQKQ